MTAQVWLYVASAVTELLGVLIGAVEIRGSRREGQALLNHAFVASGYPYRYPDNPPPDDEALIMSGKPGLIIPLVMSVMSLLNGNRWRRISAILLLATGVFLGLLGNLVSNARTS